MAAAAAVTPWLSIERDGQPDRAGWYECRYHTYSDIYCNWFTGTDWMVSPGAERALLFGDGTGDDHCRGLVEEAVGVAQ